MRDMIKLIIAGFTLVLMATLMVPQLSRADDSFYAGTVQASSWGVIKVNDETFKVEPQARVLLHVEEHGAIHEKRGRLSDVEPGVKVTLKLSSGVVTLIYVERYH